MIRVISKSIYIVNRSLVPVNKAIYFLSGIAIIIMMLVVTVDAVLRKVFGNAFYGSYDTVTYTLSILVFLSLVVCQIRRTHFSIDILTSRLGIKSRSLIHGIGFAFSVVICWLMMFQLIKFGIRLMETNATSMEFTFLPTYPFPWIGAVCFALLGLMYLLQVFELIYKKPADD